MDIEKTEAKKDNEHGKDFVSITINGVAFSIHRGHETVAAIKAVGGVPLAYELEQIVDGKLKPLDDDGAVVIHGDEKFVGHPRSGGSA